MLAGIAGAALAAWWWRRSDLIARRMSAAPERGETIFTNTPLAGM
jgi:hypothetical protein